MSNTEPRIPGIHFQRDPVRLPDEPTPRTRALYDAVVLPFTWVGRILRWLVLPVGLAFGVSLVAALVLGLFTDALDIPADNKLALAFGIVLLAGYWTMYLGSLFVALRALLHLIRR